MNPMTIAMSVHADRLLPSEPSVRALAREIYTCVRDLPIISPHGHVPPRWLSEDIAFADPASLLITPDHYVTRLLHANGVGLADLGVGRGPLTESEARSAFRILCEHWPDFRGTPVRYWMMDVLVDIFKITVRPSLETADRIFDLIAEQLTRAEFRPRALFEQFKISFLATTDDPCDDLAAHDVLRDDAAFTGRVAPTFRPDSYLEAATPRWNGLVDQLGEVAGVDTGTLAGFTEAMEIRRRYFVDHGAVSADHAHLDPGTEVLGSADADRLYAAARAGQIDPDEGAALRRHLLCDQARMACADGLVMTLHPAVARNHHRPTHEAFGTDVGCDIPISVEWTRNLQPLLNRYGTHPNFHLVLFTIDEAGYSRELAPLAGFYPSVFVGVPWWFIDAPEAIGRFRSAVTETAGFGRTSGMIDDTRAFCSIPARHDMSRRLDAGYLAQLVARHRLDLDEAMSAAHDLVVTQPTRVFKL